MKRTVTIILVMALASPLMAQSGDDTFYFRAKQDKIDASNLNMSFVGSHFMGDEIAKKLYLLKETYTWKEEASPLVTTPTTHIEKPDIYYTVKKLEKYYKKGIRKGWIEEKDAVAQYSRVLDIALFIYDQQTQDLENLLDNIKDEDQVLSVFTDKIELSY